MTRTAVVFLLVWIAGGGVPSAQRGDDGRTLLMKYLQGERSLALPEPFDIDRFLSSIEKGLPGPPELARRATAAFLLEVSAARLDAADIPGSRRLLEYACEKLRAHVPTDDFDAAWFTASLSVADAWLDAVALETHVRHVRNVRPDDPAVAMSWAIAAEQRASPAITHPRLTEPPSVTEATEARRKAERARLLEDALSRLGAAAETPSTTAEARVRAAQVLLQLDRPADALSTLAGVDTTTREGWTVYLARLFRGQTLEALKRPDDALASYRDALKVGPNGHSATMALTTLMYQLGRRDEAAALTQTLLAETDPISDPWWTYWAGSARLWTARLKTMRERLQ